MENSKLKQLTAKVLKRWEVIINRGNETDCAYCNDFHSQLGCSFSCPVFSDISREECDGTPYYEWASDPTTENAWIEYTYLAFIMGYEFITAK